MIYPDIYTVMSEMNKIEKQEAVPKVIVVLNEMITEVRAL